MNSLSTKAMLVILNISTWTGRRYDKTATNKVETDFSTQGKVGQYTKKLLPDAKELDEVVRIGARIRQYYYEQTLPWFSDGSRIISAKNYMEFSAKYRELKNEFDNAVNNFLTAYPTLVQAAQVKLGSLYTPNEYPSIVKLQNCFSCEVHFMPMPDAKDFRVEITESERQEFESKMKQVEAEAMRDVWQRLYEVVNKAATRLQSPDTIIRDSLIENIQDVCALLPKLNLNDDQTLESMRLEVERVASSIVPEVVRESQAARQDGAKALNDVMARMGAFMGAAS